MTAHAKTNPCIDSCIEDYPNFMVSDQGDIYAEWFGKFLSDCCDITRYRTPLRMPNFNANIERWKRTVREELLDRRIIFGERDLRRLLRAASTISIKPGHINP